jgi:2-polyprenyl-3-methyl-5-hydroxy-6-metoxy-1,4-benzoquinol methylase
MIDFSHRHPGPELMDRDDIPAEDLFQNYRELHTVNKWLGGYRITLKGLSQLLDEKGRMYSLLDVGCGGGDMLHEIENWAGRKNLPLRLTGIDVSEAAIQYSGKNVPGISWIHQDVFAYLRSGMKYDVIMNTLFMHHFSEEKIIELLKLMWQSSSAGIIINDLHRHPLAYHSIQLLTNIFSKSYLVKHDAAMSVRRGFKMRDWKMLIKQAGIPGADIHWEWAFRFLIVIRK